MLPEEHDPSAHYVVHTPDCHTRRFVGLGGALRYARAVAAYAGEECHVTDARTGESYEVRP